MSDWNICALCGAGIEPSVDLRDEDGQHYHRLCNSVAASSLYATARDRIAELEAELATEREHPTSILQCAACQRLAVVRNAQLEAENERLKVCGNCGWMHCDFDDCVDDVDRELPGGCSPADPCHFAPSRWTERGWT